MKYKRDPLLGKAIVDGMTAFQLSRWLALFEGVNLVADQAEKRGQKFSQMNIKQPALEDYIDSMSTGIFKELTTEKETK